jgi:predicted acetyltransferase
VKPKWEDSTPQGELRVNEAIAVSPEGTAELWRYLFGIDLVTRVKAGRVDPSWALFLMVEDARRLHPEIAEGLWLRIVDLDGALRAREFGAEESAVLEITDSWYDRNAGRWRVGGETGRTDDDADVALDIADLASAYLGAFSFEQLAAAGRARELRPGGLARATARFSTPMPPWCPEGF